MSNVQEQLTPQVTPLMKQYLELKSQVGDALLFFRMGDFYELFGNDAVIASQILEITLTSRDRNKPNPTPMAGFPHHSAQGYIQRLLRAGKKVAIGEQMEDPALVSGKSIVRREIIRTFTPGIQFDLEGAEPNYIAVLFPAPGKNWILGCLDASTGESRISDKLDVSLLAGEIASLSIRHLLRFESPDLDVHLGSGALSSSLLIETLPKNYIAEEQANELLKAQYAVGSLDAFLNLSAQTSALGVLVTYVLRSQKQERLSHLKLPLPLHTPQTLILGPRTAQHLDLLPSQEGAPHLFELINHTKSALGSRQLKRWMLEPLCNPAQIQMRQDGVKELAQPLSAERDRIAAALSEVYDLERIAGRVNTGLANPRDTYALGKSLAALPGLYQNLSSAVAPALQNLKQRILESEGKTTTLREQILQTQREDAPFVTRDGGIFKKGFHAELDRLIALTEDGQSWLVQLEARERQATGISSLKVRYNRVFGYYIEVTQTHLKNVPDHYQRKQTTVGAERFFTEELKKFEDEIVHASSRQKALEQELFQSLLITIQNHTRELMFVAEVVGELDSMSSLALQAQEHGWCFPEIDDSLDLKITEGRHPLVDRISRGNFVPNTLELGPTSRMSLIITGPNMGGKSTVMRQAALTLILGQMGSAVPAQAARWGVVSRLYTRIGAHDAIARGQSTFMVEMSELAHILHHAEERSFIVLDEIGRGTSTYDGLSVAWATLEWMSKKLRCRTLFATHYHELTSLAGELPGVANAHMGVEGAKNGSASKNLRFLYRLKDGPAQESFGIHVAQLAGLPQPVVQRAWKILDQLEHSNTNHPVDPSQLSLFSSAAQAEVVLTATPTPHPLLIELQNTEINHMTPIQALNFVVRLQEIARESTELSV